MKIWGPYLPTLIGFQYSASTWLDIMCESLSIQMENEKRDRGSPCLMPLEGLQLLVYSPFHVILYEGDKIQW